jgi:peptidoglycan/LPS O-acetylase OafA/YrhL
MTEPHDEPRTIQSFDVARCLAAVLVALSHIRDIWLTDYAGQRGPLIRLFYFLTGFGHQAVIVFFVLSGYWISKIVIERDAKGSWTWVRYYVERLTRLWVVLLPALVLGLACDVLSSRVFHFTGANLGSHSLVRDWGAHLTAPTFLANAVFLQTLVAPVLGSNGPLWSLAYEFWYYLWFPAIFVLIRRRTPVSWAMAAVAVGTIIAFPVMLPGAVCWLCGTGCYLLSRRLGRIAAIPALAAVGAFVVMLTATRLRVFPLDDQLLAVATACALLCARRWRAGWLSPLAAFGAGSSFSLYVIHYPIVILAAAVLDHHPRLRASPAAIGQVFALLAVLIAAGWGFSRLTEAHTVSVRRRFLALRWTRLPITKAVPSKS